MQNVTGKRMPKPMAYGSTKCHLDLRIQEPRLPGFGIFAFKLECRGSGGALRPQVLQVRSLEGV
jgi:hypothetical protein